MSRVNYIAAMTVLLSLSACATPTRLCPVYEHTSAEQWVPGSVGSTYQYKPKTGQNESYVVDAITSYPAASYTAKYRNNGLPPFFASADDVTCTASRNVDLVSTDRSHRISMRFTHRNKPSLQPDEDPITISMGIYSEEGSTQNISVTLRSPYSSSGNKWYENNGSFSDHTFYPERSINGREYSDVLSVNVENESSFAKSSRNNPYSVESLVFARGHGIVQFIRLDGQVFDLVSEIP